MTLYCSTCGPLRPFTSLLIDNEAALQELGEKLTKHVAKDHPILFKKVQESIAVATIMVAGYIAVAKCVKVPEDEKFVLARQIEQEEKIMEILGFTSKAATD